jgi:hypothetical protein
MFMVKTITFPCVHQWILFLYIVSSFLSVVIFMTRSHFSLFEMYSGDSWNNFRYSFLSYLASIFLTQSGDLLFHSLQFSIYFS